ncbi:DUF1007 family protein [Paracoccus sp. Ld10]|uniref:DUF1007 family protein n=1 Tax=Paracoccus sp. Ld10 TaxID=649158 RepID=UPI00386480DE
MTPRVFCLSTLLIAAPLGALAHPHVFIDAGLSLRHDASGALTHLAVEWAYDEFYSLLIIEDLGLDPDGDGVLTPDEQAALQGFDADWEPGFDGRLYLETDSGRPALDGPQDFAARYQDGRLISAHVRPLATPLDGDVPLTIKVYDPEYYVQFSVPEPPAITRTDCTADLRMGDPYAASDAYARAVGEALGDGESAEEADLITVDIGATGADSVQVRCGLQS